MNVATGIRGSPEMIIAGNLILKTFIWFFDLSFIEHMGIYKNRRFLPFLFTPFLRARLSDRAKDTLQIRQRCIDWLRQTSLMKKWFRWCPTYYSTEQQLSRIRKEKKGTDCYCFLTISNEHFLHQLYFNGLLWMEPTVLRGCAFFISSCSNFAQFYSVITIS